MHVNQADHLMDIATAEVLAVRKTICINWTNPKTDKKSFFNFLTLCRLRCLLCMMDQGEDVQTKV